MKGYHKTNKSTLVIVSCVLITILLFSSILPGLSYVRASEVDIYDSTIIKEDVDFTDKQDDIDSNVIIDSSGAPVVVDETKANEPVSLEPITESEIIEANDTVTTISDDVTKEVDHSSIYSEPELDEGEVIKDEVIKEEVELDRGDDSNNLNEAQQFPSKEVKVNTFTISSSEIKVIRLEKVWFDNHNDLGLRPEQIQVVVTGPKNYNEIVILDNANNWSHNWESTNLVPGTYSVEEIVPEHYGVSYSYKQNNLDVIKGEKKVSSGTTWNFSDPELNYPNYIAIKKGNQFAIWTRSELADKEMFLKNLTGRTLPSNFNDMTLEKTIFVHGAGKFHGGDSNSDLGVTITLSGDSEGTITFEEPNYWSLYIHGRALTEDQITLTNTLVNPTVNIQGSKLWEDNEDQAGHRPESIEVTLKGQINNNNIVYKDTIIVTENKGWTYKWIDLPRYQDGDKEISYSIYEENVPKYRTSIEGYNLINTYIADVPITITKIVTGNFGEKIWNFDFTVTINEGDSIPFNLSHDSSTHNIEGVSPGDKLKITEDAKGYEVTVKVNGNILSPNTDGSYTIEVKDMENISITVTNNFDVIIGTGIFMNILPLTLILSFVLVALISIFIRKSKLQKLIIR